MTDLTMYEAGSRNEAGSILMYQYKEGYDANNQYANYRFCYLCADWGDDVRLQAYPVVFAFLENRSTYCDDCGCYVSEDSEYGIG